MTLLAMSLIVAVLPYGRADDRCDMVEVNHVCDAAGCMKFTQVIAWEWLPDYCVHRAQDWRIITWWSVDGNNLMYRDNDKLRTVRSRIIRETWTHHDPEIADRNMFPVSKRVKVFSR